MTIYERIRNGEFTYSYKQGLPSDTTEEAQKKREHNRKGRDAAAAKFKAALEEEFGVVGHAKADELYRIAYEKGHSYGLYEVYNEYSELVELIR